jgi:hypothetical protein
MTVHPLHDPKTPIGEILDAAGSDGLLLRSDDHKNYVLLPLDDDVIDLLLERSPEFRAECDQIRQRMNAGQFQTHDQVRMQLLED